MRAIMLSLGLLLSLSALVEVRPGYAQSTSISKLDPRWGVLGVLAGRDFEYRGNLITFRWKNTESLEWNIWSGTRPNRSLVKLDPISGNITLETLDFKGAPVRWRVTDNGILEFMFGNRWETYLSIGADGVPRIFDASIKSVFAASQPSEGKMLALLAGSKHEVLRNKLIADGKLTAPDANPPHLLSALASLMNRSGSSTTASPATRVAEKSAPSTPAVPVASPVMTNYAPSPQGVPANGQRIALVIGNAAYGAAFGSLANPVNDARAVSLALRAAGFVVVQVDNADQRTMKRAIAAFGDRLTAAGNGATGLFYYAGHGVQSRGANYLVPVGAAIDSEADVDIEAVAADAVVRQMEEAGASTSIVILDACRNLPLRRALRDGTRGLARMDAPNGSFVAYSTAPGSVAVDGTGANSPFAQAFVAEMAKPGQPIEAVFRNVRRTVLTTTAGKQTPWDSSSLLDSFVFTPAP